MNEFIGEGNLGQDPKFKRHQRVSAGCGAEGDFSQRGGDLPTSASERGGGAVDSQREDYAVELVDIRVVDHVIVGENCVSLASLGLL